MSNCMDAVVNAETERFGKTSNSLTMNYKMHSKMLYKLAPCFYFRMFTLLLG